MARIKICGLFRDEDIDYANEAGPDYIGFVFAPGRHQICPARAARFRERLDKNIVPVGVFVNQAIDGIAALFRDKVIGMAQLHGDEDARYIRRLRESCGVPVIKVFRVERPYDPLPAAGEAACLADYCLVDSGAGSGRTFDWKLLARPELSGDAVIRADSSLGESDSAPGAGFFAAVLKGRPWFLAGGIGLENMEAALATGAYGIDVSSGAETDGVKDREKMIQLVHLARKSL
ncbi:MAG: phosphoribosylanthranilate isomerase [Spirochaetaceae bacterium]|jgi:phosphoribosylanthranilate isomerase|nr:phosphoribosylanthranilate isomerase [Spirochaetaceae bacterium]